MNLLPVHIQDCIDEAKALASGKTRNKVLSKLEDALVWAKELSPLEGLELTSGCICPAPGVRNRGCPATIHK